MDTNLRSWLEVLAALKSPSVFDILVKCGYPYEAGVIGNLIMAFEQTQTTAEKKQVLSD